jgi:uncharacterized protein
MDWEFQIFAKPVGSACNLQCSYCYYLGKEKAVSGSVSMQMGSEVLEQYIIQHIEATGDDVVMFSWHGGEPTLAGIDFFRKAVCLQRKYLGSGKRLINGLQTNGTLIDDDWCRFLAEENFMVGLSLDGTEVLHNRYRRNKGSSGSFLQAVSGFRLLQSYGITPEILCVVNAENVVWPLEVYEFFRQLGVRYLSFLPLVEHIPGSTADVSSESVKAEAFGQFLIRIFDRWVENDIGTIKVQIFEEAARKAFECEHTLCIFKVNCGGVPVISHLGNFYSCDHYVDSDHLLGNILDKPLSFYLGHPRQLSFGMLKSDTLPGYCRTCPVLDMCNGECPKNRFICTPSGEAGLNYLCQGYKMFFTHCTPFVEAIGKIRRNEE